MQIERPYYDPLPVELTDERERHIQKRHPDLLPTHREALIGAVRDPDQVLATLDPDKRLLVKWWHNIRGGKYLVVMIRTEWQDPERHWVVTAYLDSVPPGKQL